MSNKLGKKSEVHTVRVQCNATLSQQLHSILGLPISLTIIAWVAVIYIHFFSQLVVSCYCFYFNLPIFIVKSLEM